MEFSGKTALVTGASSGIGRDGHDPTMGSPDSAAWGALFGPALPVAPYRLKAEILDSMSIGFNTIKADFEERAGRRVRPA